MSELGDAAPPGLRSEEQAGLHDLWNRGEAPTQDEERALMARFGMETV
jgi:hypothetical protein